ncbi:MAG TPA: leucyl aminopeptidase [Acidimicrobiia bacterium]
MPVTFTTSSTSPSTVTADLLAIPVFADGELGPGGDVVDDALEGELGAFIEEADFQGKAGETLAVSTGGALGAKAAVLIGLGDQDQLTVESFRTAAASLAKRGKKVASIATTLLDAAPDDLDRAAVAQAIAEGVILGGYQFLAYKTDGEASKLSTVALLGRGGSRVRAALDRGASVANAVCWARDMVNTPSGEKSPEAFAHAAEQLLRNKGVKVEVLDVPQLKKERLGGILGVGQGSRQTPRLVKMTYAPRGARGKVALVGKGVVFDSGGLSLKTAGGMETMKTDMSGAAAVIASMSALRDLGVTTKVIGYAPMVENMPSGAAIRPGDVLTFRNGKTAEVLNTDAEGRLILADALSLAAEEEPDGIIDLATLTGACVVALGEKIGGLMAGDEAWGDQVQEAADRAGESMWPLPLPKQYRKMLDSEVADMKNISHGGYGGALTAGLFLEEFVNGVPWVHLDIAGPARAGADEGYTPRGGTGFGVRTLLDLLTHYKARRR